MPYFRAKRVGLISMADLHTFKQQLVMAKDSLLVVKEIHIKFRALVEQKMHWGQGGTYPGGTLRLH